MRSEAVRILVVEDDEALGRALTRGLQDEGYLVDWADDAATAEDHVRSRSYEVILLDRLLPGRRGEHVLADWRRSGVETPVLILSALDAVDERVRGLRAGADDYLPKPFDFTELLARIEALSRRNAGAAVGLQLDPSALEARLGDVRVTLREKEFHLLDSLYRNLGRVLTRDALRAGAWLEPEEVADNTLDVQVRNLRLRLAPFGERIEIETVRGVGYRLSLKS
ncbi:MAG TPA: response regulator transcription factor [Limnochordia bacterium]|nr:response regulator transcription factor [Limnochordia bacterium]